MEIPFLNQAKVLPANTRIPFREIRPPINHHRRNHDEILQAQLVSHQHRILEIMLKRTSSDDLVANTTFLLNLPVADDGLPLDEEDAMHAFFSRSDAFYSQCRAQLPCAKYEELLKCVMRMETNPLDLVALAACEVVRKLLPNELWDEFLLVLCALPRDMCARATTLFVAIRYSILQADDSRQPSATMKEEEETVYFPSMGNVRQLELYFSELLGSEGEEITLWTRQDPTLGDSLCPVILLEKNMPPLLLVRRSELNQITTLQQKPTTTMLTREQASSSRPSKLQRLSRWCQMTMARWGKSHI